METVGLGVLVGEVFPVAAVAPAFFLNCTRPLPTASLPAVLVTHGSWGPEILTGKATSSPRGHGAVHAHRRGPCTGQRGALRAALHTACPRDRCPCAVLSVFLLSVSHRHVYDVDFVVNSVCRIRCCLPFQVSWGSQDVSPRVRLLYSFKVLSLLVPASLFWCPWPFRAAQ